MKKTKFTFVVPKKLRDELRESTVKDGYGLRGKSTWVAEAVERLLEMPNFAHLVNLSNEMSGFSEVETVVMEPKLKLKLEEAVITVRKEFPSIEGVQSQILRTAIIQRMVRGGISSNWKIA